MRQNTGTAERSAEPLKRACKAHVMPEVDGAQKMTGDRDDSVGKGPHAVAGETDAAARDTHAAPDPDPEGGADPSPGEETTK